MEEFLYTGWEAQWWWGQVSEESSWWSKLSILLWTSCLFLSNLIIMLWVASVFFPIFVTVLKIWNSQYLWCRVSIQVLEQRSGHSFLECKHAISTFIYWWLHLFVCLYLHSLSRSLMRIWDRFCCLLDTSCYIVIHSHRLAFVVWIPWSVVDCKAQVVLCYLLLHCRPYFSVILCFRLRVVHLCLYTLLVIGS